MMAAASPEAATTVEYYLKSGQLSWALVALIIGMPASWKTLGMIGRFIARRFDNRDELVTHLLEAQTKEHQIRMLEAEGNKALGDGLKSLAAAIMAKNGIDPKSAMEIIPGVSRL